MEIKPYRVIHYPFDAALLSDVSCPPYDKVNDEMIASCRKRHPHNFIRAIIGETLSDHAYYDKAAETMRRWLEENVLQREDSDKILVYRQSFTHPSTGETCHRTGFFALLRLPEPDQTGVLPHERTFAAHKADRLRLYRAAQGTPEAIFVLYSDRAGEVHRMLRETPASVSFMDAVGETNQLGLLEDAESIQTVQALIGSQNLLIADGHHRFETGVNFRNECRAQHPDAPAPQPWDYILVYFTPIEDPGLAILPTHRLVKGLSLEKLDLFHKHMLDFFTCEELPGTADAASIKGLAGIVEKGSSQTEMIGLATAGRLRLYHLRDGEKLKSLLPADVAAPLRGLPVVWLHRILFDHFLGLAQEEGAPDRIAYVRTADDVHEGLTAGGYGAAFILRGTRADEVRQVAENGHRMPQKSTDFYPKALSGMALYLYP